MLVLAPCNKTHCSHRSGSGQLLWNLNRRAQVVAPDRANTPWCLFKVDAADKGSVIEHHSLVCGDENVVHNLLISYAFTSSFCEFGAIRQSAAGVTLQNSQCEGPGRDTVILLQPTSICFSCQHVHVVRGLQHAPETQIMRLASSPRKK